MCSTPQLWGGGHIWNVQCTPELLMHLTFTGSWYKVSDTFSGAIVRIKRVDAIFKFIVQTKEVEAVPRGPTQPLCLQPSALCCPPTALDPLFPLGGKDEPLFGFCQQGAQCQSWGYSDLENSPAGPQSSLAAASSRLKPTPLPSNLHRTMLTEERGLAWGAPWMLGHGNW